MFCSFYYGAIVDTFNLYTTPVTKLRPSGSFQSPTAGCVYSVEVIYHLLRIAIIPTRRLGVIVSRSSQSFVDVQDALNENDEERVYIARQEETYDDMGCLIVTHSRWKNERA